MSSTLARLAVREWRAAQGPRDNSEYLRRIKERALRQHAKRMARKEARS